MKRFVILGLPRSGTNNLQSLLNCHPEVFCWGEHFIGISDTDLPRRFPSLRESSEVVTKTAEDFYLNDFFSGEYFLRLHKDRSNPWNFGNPCAGKRVVGFRFFDYHQSRFGLDFLLRKNYKIIFIERSDLFWSTISHVLMHRNIIIDKSYGWENTIIKEDVVNIERNEFLDIYNKRKESIDRCKNFLKENNLNYIHINYEKMFNSRVYDSIFNFLGLSPLPCYPDRYLNKKDNSVKYSAQIKNIKSLMGVYYNER